MASSARAREVGSEEEQDFIGIPGLLEPAQVSDLLRQRQAKHVDARRRRGAAGARLAPADQASIAVHRQVAALRKELSSLVAVWARRTGAPHGAVHADLRRRTGGEEVARVG